MCDFTWMRIENLIENVKTGIIVYTKNRDRNNAELNLASSKFTLDMLGEIGEIDPKIYKTIFILHKDILVEMLTLCNEKKVMSPNQGLFSFSLKNQLL